MLTAQVGGAVLLVGPPLILWDAFASQAILAVGVGIATCLYFALVYRDRLFGAGLLNAAQRCQRYRSWLGALIAADILVVLAAIGLSGGLSRSHLSFVLLLIPATAGIMRGGGRTVGVTCAAIIVVALWEVIGPRLRPATLTPTVLAAQAACVMFGWVVRLRVLDPSASARFDVAQVSGICVGIVLTLIQSRLAAGRILPDRVRTGALDKIEKDRSLDPIVRAALGSAVSDAYRRMSRIVSQTNEPEIHSSMVHPLEDVTFQAAVLAMPGISYGSRGAVKRTAAMVYGVHWLDDLIDAHGYHKLLFENGARQSFNILTATSEDVANVFHPYGVGRIIAAIHGRRRFMSNIFSGAPRWKEGIEMGLMRVICGGLIQCGDSVAQEMAVQRIRKDTMKHLVDRGLQEMLSSQNKAYWWGVSKTAMPLVLGMFWNPRDDRRLYEKTVVLDACFMPLLVWHNLEEELRRGEVKDTGFGAAGVTSELDEAIKGSMKVVEHCTNDLVLERLTK